MAERVEADTVRWWSRIEVGDDVCRHDRACGRRVAAVATS